MADENAPVLESPPTGFEIISRTQWLEFPVMRRADLLFDGHAVSYANAIWIYPGALTEDESLLLEPDFEDTEVEERKGATYSMPLGADE